MAKRIMREFRLDEISAVTVPAQEHAKMLIMKRGEGEKTSPAPADDPYSKLSPDAIAAGLEKGQMKLTSAVNGHTHLVDLDMYCRERGGGWTSSYGEYDTPGYHRHPFVVNDDGSISIGEASGHSHEVAGITTKSADGPPAHSSTSKKGETMTEQEMADFAKFKALAEMTDAQKAHFGKLSGDAATAFVKMSPAEREAAVTNASASDPVIYKGGDGAEYRQSDDPRLISMAKTVDASMNALKVVQTTAQEAEAEALAKSWTHIGKPHAEKVELAKGIVALPEPAKKAALEAIEASAQAIAPLFKSLGALGGNENPESLSAEAEIDKMAKEYASANSVSLPVAVTKVLETAKGAELYAKTVQH